MRRDAVANRERILETAEVYFAENGVDASLQGLAQAAKVGTGTLYRNFASQEQVVRALYDRVVVRFDRIAGRALGAPTGWEALERVVRETVPILVESPLTAEIMRRQATNDPDYRPSERWFGPIRRIVQRAKDEGSARPDLEPADLAAAPFVLGAMHNFAPDNRPGVARRMAALLLDGMRAHPHQPSVLPEVPPTFMVGPSEPT